jgi:hypothetical protein
VCRRIRQGSRDLVTVNHWVAVPLPPLSRMSTLSSSSFSMEVTPDNQRGVRSVSPEKRDWIRKESETILARNLILREKTKEEMYEKRIHHERLLQVNREDRLKRWVNKTKNSPFAVNLVAEDERIVEENAIRQKEESERRKMIDKRKEMAKNEIVLKALSEFSDLEALRREKRAILDEEQRLRALLTLEKVSLSVSVSVSVFIA